MATIKPFITRDEYITWRAAWRTEYKNLSIAIRTLKNAISESMRNNECVGQSFERLWSLQHLASNEIYDRDISKIQAGLLRENPELKGAALEDAILINYEKVIAKRKERSLASQEKAKALAARKKSERKVSNKTTPSSDMLAAD